METWSDLFSLKLEWYLTCFAFLQLLKLRVVKDTDKCRENYKICFYHFYMIICHIEWYSNGENFMLIAFLVFEI